MSLQVPGCVEPRLLQLGLWRRLSGSKKGVVLSSRKDISLLRLRRFSRRPLQFGRPTTSNVCL